MSICSFQKIVNYFFVDQIFRDAKFVKNNLSVADDKIQGCLKTVIVIHNYSTMIMFASNICFFLSTLAPIWSSYKLHFPFLISASLGLFFSLVGVICFFVGRFNFIKNILILLDVYFFYCFLAIQVVVDLPNVLSMPQPNFGSFFLLSCFLQLIL